MEFHIWKGGLYIETGPSVQMHPVLIVNCFRRWLDACSAFLSFLLQWRHNGHTVFSNHRPLDCILKRLFRRKSKKTSKLRATGHCKGNHRWPVNSPHKWPVTRKMFPFDDVIMISCKFKSQNKTFHSKALETAVHRRVATVSLRHKKFQRGNTELTLKRKYPHLTIGKLFISISHYKLSQPNT